MPNKTYCCPDCGSERITVDVVTTYYVNSLEYVGTTSSQEADAPCWCFYCLWEGKRSELKETKIEN